jgi:hypothetical protein
MTQERNTMAAGMRLFWVGAIAIAAFASVTIYLAGLESLEWLAK